MGSVLQVLCNGAEFVRNPTNDALAVDQKEVTGDATETALLKYFSNNADSDAVRAANPVVLEVPFSSEKKWAASIR